MKKLTLSQIGLYNPQRLSDEVMESLFVIRQKTFDFIIGKIQDEPAGSIPQHYLIVGQRGMGKTTLLKRLEVELRKETYKSRFIPLLLPEEQYNLKNLAEFWLNCLDALADTLETEKQADEVKKLDTKVKELQGVKENDELAREAYAYFKSVCNQLGRRPVLLIDNMSFIFDRFDKAGQHKLRGILMQNGAPVLVGASAVAMDDTYDYGAPFYDAFQTYYLSKINFNELLDILTNLARLTGSDEVIQDIHKESGRLKALHLLTGGNPRTAVMLFRLIVKGFSPEINDDLEALLDEITPLYKARFEELSTQMQVIVDAIALNWDPIVLEELRTETRYENQQLSPQLKRLEELGWIERLEAYQAKGKAYQITERFFNIWFLMRRSSRRQKRELYCLSKFLETFYGNELESIAQKRLDIPSKTIDHAMYNLAMAEAVRDRNLKNALRSRSYTVLREHAKEDPRILENFTIPQDIDAALEEEERLLEAISRDRGNFYLWEQLGFLYHLNLKDSKKAEQAYLKAIDLGSVSSWSFLGTLYHYYLKKYAEAENAYKIAIELDNTDAYAWNDLGFLYQYCLGKYVEAEIAYKKAIELNNNNASTWNDLGNLYQYNLGKYVEAEYIYNKTIELDDNYYHVWNDLGNLYQYRLEKYTEAEKAYKKAIELDTSYAKPWTGLGNLYLYNLERYAEAENAYKEAIELDANYATPWNGLGHLYQHKLERYAEAENAYKKAIKLNINYEAPWLGLGTLYQRLGEYKQAENTYKKAIEVDPSNIYAWTALGSLYHYDLEKYEEAESAYKKGVEELDSKYVYPWKALGSLYHYNLGKYFEAENVYKKAIELDSMNPGIWSNLGNLYQDHLENYAEAEIAYKKAIEINNDILAWYNLIFLYRDKLNDYQKAKEMFENLEKESEISDYYWLNQTIFDLSEKNEGIAKQHLQNAFRIIENRPPSIQAGWLRFGAVVHKLGYTRWFTELLEEHGLDIALGPYYIALKAIMAKDPEGFLKSKAVEFREPSKKLMEIMLNYIA